MSRLALIAALCGATLGLTVLLVAGAGGDAADSHAAAASIVRRAPATTLPTSTVARRPTAAAANALDTLRFGNTTSEGAHAMTGAPGTAGSGAFGQSHRVIVPSPSAAGDGSQNLALRFVMACDPVKQNYITVKLWGGDTTPGFLYLYEESRGYDPLNYYEYSRPELDFQAGTDPVSPGRFVYVTYPIPFASTQGRTSVALQLNAARSTGTQLAAGQTSRPVYAAWTHTATMLNLFGSDVRSSVATPIAPVALTFDAAYANRVRQDITNRIPSMTLNHQLYGSAWTAAVTAGKVPGEILGLVIVNVTPDDVRTLQQWRDYAVTRTVAGNNAVMHRLTLLAAAYERDIAPGYYRSTDSRDRFIAALDGYWQMQSLDGAFGGGASSWFGIHATTSTGDNPQGRLNTGGSRLEGEGTQALGRMFIAAANDSTFLSALDQDIDATLAPGVKRWQAYAQMFSRHASFLHGHRGSAPNQDHLQAYALLLAHHAEKLLVARYPGQLGTTTITDAQMLTYLHQATGVLPSLQGPYWLSSQGLSLEVHGVGNGGYDGGGYGTNGMNLVIKIARSLKELGYETGASHPVRDVAVKAVHAFSNFYMPSVTAAGVATLRRENNITFRKNSNLGGVDTGASYTAAVQFGDAHALHGVFLQKNVGIRFVNGSEVAWSDYATEAADYLTLIDRIGSGAATDSVTFLHEDAHPDGAWVDVEAGAITFKQNGNHGFIALNHRPYGYGERGQYRNPSNPASTVSNTARMHLLGRNIERVATIAMPTDAATDATNGFSSGSYGGLYLVRFGPFVQALNLQSGPAAFTPPASTNARWAQDWVTGVSTDRSSAATWNLGSKTGALLTLGATQAAARQASIESYCCGERGIVQAGHRWRSTP
ncbi:MAG: hypothetical protein H7Y19_09370 [Luteimonas sp.]|nr:hypothetical protein [Luteimonas sp.]